MNKITTKRPKRLIALCVCVAVALCGAALAFWAANKDDHTKQPTDKSQETDLGPMPFKDLSEHDIAAATVELYPPDTKVDLNTDEIRDLIAVLRTVEIYNRDDSYTEYVGQAVIYTLTKTDGTQEKIMELNPFIVINDIGYKTKYEPCEELNALGNTIAKTSYAQ
jgi:hypothetical protein